MKKFLKRVTYVFSLAALMMLVFSSNVVSKFGKEEDAGQKDAGKQPDSLFSAFSVNQAYADAPAGGGGGDGSSADGNGCSACGASSGDGCGGDGCGGY